MVTKGFGLGRKFMSKVLRFLYQWLGGKKRGLVAAKIFKLYFRLEGGAYRSTTVRELLSRDYSVDVGLHSYGEMFVPGAFAPSVTIGRYVSVARGVRVFTQNHPIDWITTHPYFYESKFGYVDSDQLKPARTQIGHDVWIGQGAIILPGCRTVGTGSIIGAGAVVTKDVPDYAIVAGNPAKIIKYRFPEATRQWLLNSQWWLKSPSELAEYRAFMCSPCASEGQMAFGE